MYIDTAELISGHGSSASIRFHRKIAPRGHLLLTFLQFHGMGREGALSLIRR
jgi:hypothetical protein